MRYTADYINGLTFKSYLELMADELNENGFTDRYSNKYSVGTHLDLFMMSPIADPKAMDFLRSCGLIDNGRCPKCGAPMSVNRYYWSNPKYPTYFCVCYGCYSSNGRGDGKSLDGTIGGIPTNSGCVIALLLLPFNLIKYGFTNLF